MAQTISMTMPKFLEPVDRLLKTTIEKTQIQPNKLDTGIVSILEAEVEVSIPLPSSPPFGPDVPFSIVLNHPIFGIIESPVFIPRISTKKEKKYKNSRTSRRGNKGKVKKFKERNPAPGASFDIVQANSNQMIAEQQKSLYQENLLERYLNLLLIYFKCVESRVNSTLEGNTCKIPSQKNMESLNSLTKDLRAFIESLEKFYAEEDMIIAEIENKIQFQDILQCTARLQKVLEQLDASDIAGLLQKNFDKRDEHMLCSILGLEDEVADYLINLKQNVRSHQTDEHWILSYINEKDEILKENCDTKLCLMDLGFTAAKAQHLTNIINRNPLSDHQTLAYWAKTYIEQQFSCHILLSPNRSCPLNDNQIFDRVYTIETVPDEGAKPVSIEVVDTKNMAEEDDLSSCGWLTDFLSQRGNTIQGCTYWFHGTDHKSAMNIMNHGIDLDKGKAGGDFSDGRGFYVTSDYKFAHQWPQKMMKKPNTAVIVFKLENTAFEDQAGIEFVEDSQDWKNAVGFFRNKKDYNWCERKKAKKLIRCPYIFGPISRDGNERKSQNWSPKERKPRIFELCIKDDFLADAFYNCGHNIYKTILFFD